MSRRSGCSGDPTEQGRHPGGRSYTFGTRAGPPPPIRRVRDLARRLRRSERAGSFANANLHLHTLVLRHLGADATFEQRRDAAAALVSDALWLDADEDLRKLVTSADEVIVDRRRYRRLDQASSATYSSRWGSHRIEEALYHKVGERNGPTIKPIEMRAGIIEHMTPDMARVVGELGAERSSRGVERTVRVTGLVPPSRAFLAKRSIKNL